MTHPAGPSDDNNFDDQAVVDALLRERDGGDSTAAEEHLKAGRPIFIREDDTPRGVVIRLWPDGHREFVTCDDQGNVIVLDRPSAAA